MVGDIKILATSLSEFSCHVNGTRHVYSHIYMKNKETSSPEDALVLVMRAWSSEDKVILPP